VAVAGFAVTENLSEVLTVPDVPFPGSQGGHSASYRIDTTSGERLVARVHAEGATTRLLLRDVRGRVLLQSDSQSAADSDARIDLHIPAGSVSLEVESLGGAGTSTL